MTVASLGRWLCWAALLLGLAATLRPVTGSNIMGTDVSLTCGPALTAALRLSEPDDPEGAIMWPGSDLGIGRGAWCEVEAREWLVPVGAASLGTFALGGALLAAGRSRAPEREEATRREEVERTPTSAARLPLVPERRPGLSDPGPEQRSTPRGPAGVPRADEDDPCANP